MNPVYLLFLSFACGLSAIILVWVNNPMSRVFFGLTALWAVAAVIPAIVLELGFHIAEYKHYVSGAQLVKLSEKLCQYISAKHAKLMCPVYLSRIFLMQDQPEMALSEAKRSIDMHTEADSWLSLFFAYTAAGTACFAQAEYETASDFFNKAWEASGGYDGLLTSDAIWELQSTVHADNLHMLGLISLHAGHGEKAERLFDRSSRLRKETEALRPSSDAYDEISHGIIALKEGNVIQATERTLCAASLLPKDLSPFQHVRVAFYILGNLRLLESARAAEVFNQLYSVLDPQMHPGDLRIINANLFERPYRADQEHVGDDVFTVLLNIEERLSKRLPAEAAQNWQQRFRSAMADADVHRVWVDFILWLLEDAEEGAIRYVSEPQDRQAIQQVAMLYRNGCVNKEEWKLAAGAAHGAAKSITRNIGNAFQSIKKGGAYAKTFEEIDLAQHALSVAALAADASAYDSWDRAGLVVDVAAGLVAKVAMSKEKTDAGKDAWRQAMKSAYVHISKKLLELSDVKRAESA